MTSTFWTVWDWWAGALLDLHRCPITSCTDEQAKDLETMLGKTIAEWKAKHHIEVAA